MTNSTQTIEGVDKNELAFAVNTISGVCAMPFWDGIYELRPLFPARHQAASLATFRGIRSMPET